MSDRDTSFPDALSDSEVRIWIQACNHEPARQALRQLLAYRVRDVSKPLSLTSEGESAQDLPRDDTGRVTSDYEPTAQEIEVCRNAICREFGNNGTDGYYIRILKAINAVRPTPQPAQPDLEERIDNAVQAMAETHSTWESRCHAIMAALGFNFGWDEPQHDDAQAHIAALTAKVEELTLERDGARDDHFRRHRLFVMRDEDARSAEARVAKLEEALEKLRSYNVDIEAGRINYRPNDHVAVIDSALHPEKEIMDKFLVKSSDIEFHVKCRKCGSNDGFDVKSVAQYPGSISFGRIVCQSCGGESHPKPESLKERSND